MDMFNNLVAGRPCGWWSSSSMSLDASTALRPAVSMSLLHTSFHLVSGRHFFFFLVCLSSVLTIFTMCSLSLSLLIKSPHHFSCLSVIFLGVCVTLVVPILYYYVTPRIHFNILISFVSVFDSCRFVAAQVCSVHCWSDSCRSTVL